MTLGNVYFNPFNHYFIVFHLVLKFLEVVYYNLANVTSAVVAMYKRNAIKISQDVLLDLFSAFSTFFFGHLVLLA